MRKICVFETVEQLNQYVAQEWVQQAKAAIQERGAFFVSLAGGGTPKKLYQLLAQDYSDAIDWGRTHVFFGDERFVPQDHEDSNYRMAKETFLSILPVAESNIHAVPTQLDSPQACAQAYAEELKALPMQDGIPSFDLMLLGMGDDGHTASLFPQTEVLDETLLWAKEVYVEKFQSWRISLTFPVINASRSVLFLVSGESKAQTMAQVLSESEVAIYPVQRVKAQSVQWCLDAAAAGLLTAEQVGK